MGPDDVRRRLFVAAALPESARTHLAAAVDRLRREHEPSELQPSLVRWTDPASWHLTLVFCGSVAPERAAVLVDGLGPNVARHSGLQIGLASGGRFGHRVLWTGVDGDRTALVRIAGSVAEVARAAGVALEDRPYRPHLTIARGRPGADLAPLAIGLEPYAGPTWKVEHLLLMESRLSAGPGGAAQHVEVERFPLG
jgi:2'-5' RNA ligase